MSWSGAVNPALLDPTRIDIETDPTVKRMKGVAHHGHTPFDVPFISKIGHNLWQGGCAEGMVLPRHIKHVVSLYKWERYEIEHEVESETYVTMYDSIEQGFDQIAVLADWVNECRNTGPVLVHCQAGLNRSSLLAARVLHTGGEALDGDDCVELLRAQRSPACLCNPAFEAEVRSWR